MSLQAFVIYRMLDLLGILDSINVDDADSKHVLILLSKVFVFFVCLEAQSNNLPLLPLPC